MKQPSASSNRAGRLSREPRPGRKARTNRARSVRRRARATRSPPANASAAGGSGSSAKSGEPADQALRGFGHVFGRAGKGNAQAAVAAPGIEIGSGRNRYAGFFQHPPAKGFAVIGQVADIGVEIESAV